MDVIRDFFNRHDSDLIRKLVSAGFSANQARDFLPEAVESILRSNQNTGIAVAITGLLEEPSQLMSSINTVAIGQKLKMRPEQVESGLAVIVPELSQALSQKNKNIVESIGRGTIGGFMGSAKKLFS